MNKVRVAGAWVLIATVIAAIVAGGGGGGGAFAEGTFDCYGTTGCSSLPTAATCTSTISTGLQAALDSASGGAVICLNTGSYGTASLTSKTYASDVTVRPANNATVTVGRLTLNAVTHLHLTGNGGGTATMSLNGAEVDQSSGCSTNLTFDYLTFTDATDAQPQFACSHGLNWLWDHDRFDNLGDGMREGRLNIVGPDATGLADGVTVSNSHFGGYGTGGTAAADCSDGIYLDAAVDGSPVYGTVIGPGNEFTGIDQAGGDTCGTGVHVDPIAGFSDSHTLVTGNWFHDNGSGSGGILSAGQDSLTVTNNVFASTGYANSIVDKAPLNNMTVTHNVFFENVETETGNAGETSGSGNVIRNNVFTNGGTIVIPNGTSVTYTADHNLSLDVAGTPTFVASPSSGYYHYALDASSAGYHAATDGSSLGIVP